MADLGARRRMRGTGGAGDFGAAAVAAAEPLVGEVARRVFPVTGLRGEGFAEVRVAGAGRDLGRGYVDRHFRRRAAFRQAGRATGEDRPGGGVAARADE